MRTAQETKRMIEDFYRSDVDRLSKHLLSYKYNLEEEIINPGVRCGFMSVDIILRPLTQNIKNTKVLIDLLQKVPSIIEFREYIEKYGYTTRFYATDACDISFEITW